jgi:hypothetical protein
MRFLSAKLGFESIFLITRQFGSEEAFDCDVFTKMGRHGFWGFKFCKATRLLVEHLARLAAV